MLETEEGKHLVQSWAILRFLGRKYGYYTEDPWTAWKIDSTVDAVEDYLKAYFKFFTESNEELKAIYKDNWLKMIPAWVTAIEKRITTNGGKFVTGDKINIADFALATVGFNMLLNEANPHYADSIALIKDNKILHTYFQRLKVQVGEHLTKRPQPRPF